MPLGEEPITSYFPRLPPSKSKQSKSNAKRKSCKVAEPDDQPPKAGPSRKRSRKTTTSSLSSISSDTPPPVWDLFSEPRKSKKIRRDQVINKTSSVISLNDDSDYDLATKDTMESEPRSSRRTVQMKTCTVDGERWHRINPPQPSTSNNVVHNNSIIDLSNSPSRPRRRRRSVSSSTFSSASAHGNAVHDNDRDTEVLSSQISERPDELFVCPSKYPTRSFQGNSISVTRLSNVKSPIRSSHSMLPPDNPSADNNIVESSQTQNILLNYISPRRPRIYRRFFLRDEEITDQIVQTSQTQSEIDVHARYESTPRNSNGSISRPLARMLSDVLFSVPRREATFTETDDLTPQPHEHLKELDENEAIQEESVTESDSDGEMLGFLANKSFSRQEPSGVTSLSQCYADQTQTCSSGTFDDVGSLPSVVKDFHDMFGGDGSYP
ncbi:hypothetical protein F5887DRAFT_1068928 [Amanita rubescens]|nr:hypothetical protein F5887DRAFT_1068928 [Amanita rubescens]